MAQTVVVFRGYLAKRVKEEAEKLDVSIDEYFADVISHSLNPVDRAREYIRVARDILEDACMELEKGDVRQAAEKLWGAER